MTENRAPFKADDVMSKRLAAVVLLVVALCAACFPSCGSTHHRPHRHFDPGTDPVVVDCTVPNPPSLCASYFPPSPSPSPIRK